MRTLPASGRWALGDMPREELETLLHNARGRGLRTAWLGPEAGFLSNLSLQENLELFHDWQGRTEPFANALTTALQQLGLDSPDWLEARPSQQTAHTLQTARLLRLLMLAPNLAVIDTADAARLLQLPADTFDAILGHGCLLLDGPASTEWPALPDPAMLTDTR